MENQTNFKKSTEVNLIDLKQKLAEIEVRKKIEKFEKHINSFDSQPSYFLVLAHLKLKIKDVEGALNYLNEACKLFPKAEFIYDMKAKILFKMKDYNGALMNLNQAIDLNPENELYYSRRGEALFCLKIYSKANDDYSRAIEINSLKDIYFYNRALARGCLRDFESAIADLEKTLEINPSKTRAKEIIITLKKLLNNNKAFFVFC